MLAYKTIIEALNKKANLPTDLAGNIMTYVEDPIKKWAKDNYEWVTIDIAEFGVTVPNIREQIKEQDVNYILSKNFLKILLEAVKYTEKCSKCNKKKIMKEFYEDKKKYNTCNTCRANGRRKRLHAAIDYQVNQYKRNYATTEFTVKREYAEMAIEYLHTKPYMSFFVQKCHGPTKTRIFLMDPKGVHFTKQHH
jgi:Zn finger protein HypA/HybF involved in hydrogenase expression